MSSNHEIRDENIETLEQKQKKINGHDELSAEGKRTFSDIASELGKPKNQDGKYSGEEVSSAISKRFDTMTSQKTQNLNADERAQLESIKNEILAQTRWNNPTDAIEEYSKLRTKVYGIIAASDGKSELRDKNTSQVQGTEKEQNKEKRDAFDKLKDLLNKNEERRTQVEQNRGKNLAKIAQEENRKGEKKEALAGLEELRTLA